MVLETFQKGKNLLWKTKFNGSWSSIGEGNERAVLLKPMTFMNLTGKSVQSAAVFFKVSPKDILVLHDELELPFGFLSLKSGGGTGGHNGLRSIESGIGSREFARLRIGISRPQRQQPASYVLGRFTREEEAELPDILAKASGLVEAWINSSMELLINKYRRVHYRDIQLF